MMFYVYPTLFNLQNSLTDLSLFGLKRGGQWVGVRNYVELVTSKEFRRVLYNTTVWLTLIGVSVRIVLGLLLALLVNSDTLRRWRLRNPLPRDPHRAVGHAAHRRGRHLALDAGSWSA